MPRPDTYSIYEYQREQDVTKLLKLDYRDGSFAGLDEAVKEQTIFTTKDEIALLFDYNAKCPHESVLLKHGELSSVESAWQKHKPLGEALKKAGESQLVFVKGQFSVSELNKMINIAGYVGTWYSTMINIDGRQPLHGRKEQRNTIGLSL